MSRDSTIPHSRSCKGHLAALAGCLAPMGFVLMLARSAGATAGYERSLEANLALSYTPSCTTCHASLDGGESLSAFGHALSNRGLRADQPESMKLALERARRDHVDSDGDGAEDLDELGWRGDPNTPDVPLGDGG